MTEPNMKPYQIIEYDSYDDLEIDPAMLDTHLPGIGQGDFKVEPSISEDNEDSF